MSQSYTDKSIFPLGYFYRLPNGIFKLIEDLACAVIKVITGSGYFHAVSAADQQLRAKLVLQLLNALTQRRLGHIQLARSLADRAVLDDFAEILYAF